MKLKYIKCKYALADSVHYRLQIIRPYRPVVSQFYSISQSGLLIIKKGYAWDGPSGPTIDTLDVMFASLIHDVLYEALRKKQLARKWRKAADDELAEVGKACGANPIRMELWESMVNIFAGPMADEANRKRVYEAPATEGLT